jgi:proline iminopeptidase
MQSIRWKSLVRRFLLWGIVSLFAIVAIATVAALYSRHVVVEGVRMLRHIPDPDGIDVLERVRIGEIDQWVSIRGRDRNNPVLLFIHGGPGAVAMPLSHGFQDAWEEFFTVVQWDQRGAGKTYSANDPQKVGRTMSVDRIIQDAEELVTYLRTRFHKDKIVVFGHSWGTIVGVNLAKRHPDWLSAYVGMGQVVSSDEDEAASYQFSLAEARRRGDAQGAKALEALAPFPPPPSQSGQYMAKVIAMTAWLDKFDGIVADPDTNLGASFGALVLSSPAYDLQDIFDQVKGTSRTFSVNHLFDQVMEQNLRQLGYGFECPIIFLLGRHDQTASSNLAAQYFEQIHAPAKKIVWFEHSGHFPFLEEPGAVAQALIDVVRPLANGKALPSEDSAQVQPATP